MTSKDKTGDQLLASMRKSKTGAVAQKTATQPAAKTAAKPAAKAAAKPAAKRKAPAKKAAAKPAASRSAKKQEAQPSMHFGRRVWPD